ncbi:hypothetical protein FK530_22565 [Tsukamurella conjunctivitidis]|uniref:Uncharacterized protein n=1 Tax=Tsukamurella conjunctivitidis TaxID=2592068 RepID=A0A5C5RT29_9ACTN|nr:MULTISPECIES: hypothetical protein [Tsukamurella]RDB48056.1 hypothetical protein DVB87_10035 [Tsukamurella tyrosinosolvens]TWS25623.1 hypothetical protein FK530_22565 [Tsukamurella conjunctivitidis]
MADDEQAERRRPRGAAKLADLTLIVRVPGRPADVRVFTDAEGPDAERYAAEHGATVEPLGTVQ